MTGGVVAAGAGASAGTTGSAGAVTTSAGVADSIGSAVAAAGGVDSTTAGSLDTGSVAAGASVGAASAGAATALVAGAFFAAAFLAGFFSGLTSSGCSGRVSPSRSARLVTMSAYASASDDDGPFAATPSVEQRPRTSAFVIPSSFASSWILIFLAATFPIQPFAVVIPSSMRESPGVPVAHRVVASTAFATQFFSYRLFVFRPQRRAPGPSERVAA